MRVDHDHDTRPPMPPQIATCTVCGGTLAVCCADDAVTLDGAVCAACCPKHRAQPLPATRDCRVCGGSGWTDGSAELRRDGRAGDTTCIECKGSGSEPNPLGYCASCGERRFYRPVQRDPAVRDYCQRCADAEQPSDTAGLSPRDPEWWTR